MALLANRNECTGCMACMQACPIHCIVCKKDDLGNLYPEINCEKCVDCGKCMSICPELNKDIMQFHAIKKAYAVWSRNQDSRLSSASGGAAAEFYSYALEQGYWICGVEYAEDFHVIHTLSRDMSSIKKYKQSKYVYSEMKEIYKEIRELLENEQKVLFISLPCKVAGLKGYLEKTYENLITVDIVCHGTPSYQQLKEHISNIKAKGVKLRFRYENEFVFRLMTDEDNIVYNKLGRQDTYLAAFLEGLNYRCSCYECTYARPERISDITICDFWGLGTEIPFDHPYSGAVSAVLTNTNQGSAFFEKCKKNFFVEERPIHEAVKGNAQLNHPVQLHLKRPEFEENCKKYGFEKAVRYVLKSEMQKDRVQLQRRKIRKRLRWLAGIIIPRYRR